LDFSLP